MAVAVVAVLPVPEGPRSSASMGGISGTGGMSSEGPWLRLEGLVCLYERYW